MRAIDADALKDYIDAQEGRPFIGCIVGEAFKIMVDEQPTIQPEIVMCKECKYHYQRNCPIEKYFSLDGFCSRGKRREVTT